MITLVGTPRAWQEIGNLLATAQHKAQVKFWSMVLPAGRESADAETIAAARRLEASATEVASNCPVEGGKVWEDQVAGGSRANRRTAPISFQPKARAQRPPAAVPTASHGVLIAKALKTQRGNGGAESLLHSANLPENHPLGFAESHPSSVPRPGALVAALPKPPVGGKDTYRFVLIPNANSVVPALIDKENIVHLKQMRKAFEDNKALRQKSRFPLSRSAAAFPSS